MRRGVIQGDIPSPVYFLVALDKIIKEHGGRDKGLKITNELTLSELEFADDAALPNKDNNSATNRLTILSQKSNEEAGMVISIPKTKVQHIQKRPQVSNTAEDDISNLPAERKLKFKCEKCEM